MLLQIQNRKDRPNFIIMMDNIYLGRLDLRRSHTPNIRISVWDFIVRQKNLAR